jgi:GNAT superfamily N-acetyltransferase
VSGRTPAGAIRLLGVTLVVAGLLLVVGYTAATLREIALIEAAFGERATGAGRDAMLPRMLLVDAIGLAAIAGGVGLLWADRRRRRRDAGTAAAPATELPDDVTPEVRRVRPDEVAAASAVVVAGYRDLLPTLDEGYERELADVADRAERAEVLVALLDERVVGCVTYVPGLGPYAEFEDPDAAGIRMLAVHPDAQGRGVGAALLRACVDRARDAGRGRVVLHSTEPMAAARWLYEREGFVRVPERDWEPEPGLVLLGYERLL